MSPITDRRRFSLGLAGFSLLPTAASFATISRRSTVADISDLVEAEKMQTGIPALGAAIVTSRGLEAIGVAGVRAFPDGPPVTTSDRWHIGSCTKAFTCTLAARLIQRGLLRWETTVGQIFGGEVHSGWRDVQLLWLLTHRSGAPNNFDQSSWNRIVAAGGPLREQRAKLVNESLKLAPPDPPLARTVYSNAGFMIAGVMIERATSRDWESLIRQEIFRPLGMREAGFGAPGTAGALDQPLGHVRGERPRWRRIELGPGDDIPAAAGPAGTIHVSLPDWAKFAAAHLRCDRNYLSRANWERLHMPGAKGWEYSPGWIVSRNGGGELMWQHLGSNNHFVAQATLFPARDRAVLLVTNLGDDAAEPAFRRLLEVLEAKR